MYNVEEFEAKVIRSKYKEMKEAENGWDKLIRADNEAWNSMAVTNTEDVWVRIDPEVHKKLDRLQNTIEEVLYILRNKKG